jgi:hypothetical protein
MRNPKFSVALLIFCGTLLFGCGSDDPTTAAVKLTIDGIGEIEKQPTKKLRPLVQVGDCRPFRNGKKFTSGKVKFLTYLNRMPIGAKANMIPMLHILLIFQVALKFSQEN